MIRTLKIGIMFLSYAVVDVLSACYILVLQNKKMQTQRAFTLAEVLIVLVIIGTITTIMMVGLNKSRPDEEVLLYKKAFTSAQQAVANMINDGTLYDGNFSSPAIGNSNNFCQNLVKQFSTVRTECTATSSTFETTNGMVFSFGQNPFNGGESVLIVKVCLPKDTVCSANTGYFFAINNEGNVYIDETLANGRNPKDWTKEINALKKNKVTK